LGAGALCKEGALSISDLAIALYIVAWPRSNHDQRYGLETAAQIAAGVFARDVMVSNLGQMPYQSEFGKLKLEAVWGPTALRGLEGEQNVGIATTNGAIRLLHASYSHIPYLLENTELILRAACENTRD
jgi:hypothetical protein